MLIVNTHQGVETQVNVINWQFLLINSWRNWQSMQLKANKSYSLWLAYLNMNAVLFLITWEKELGQNHSQTKRDVHPFRSLFDMFYCWQYTFSKIALTHEKKTRFETNSRTMPLTNILCSYRTISFNPIILVNTPKEAQWTHSKEAEKTESSCSLNVLF